ncbi:MAG TPA: 30S ribosome-binding factor RbfA [Candidatus Paceibacterota bacterium]|nr:30S ribosome-binding factor RbfA [Candidatus Paceibacterota bacterium]
MRFFRADRVSKLIREELSMIIMRELDFGGALVTVTGVDVDKKLEHAATLVSVIPSAAEERAMRELERHAGRLQHLLMKKINIKPMPRVSFVLDHGSENAAKIEKLLEEGQ